jgi:glycosyltransferase involved in cell wall biosynthesis
LDAARVAGVPLLLAGSVFPYTEHRRYFEAEILPRLDRTRRWIGPVTGPAKRRLVAAGQCLVAPSLAPETSALVAREALAAGTPVVALRNGALEEVVEDGRTGVLVDGPEALPEAIARAERLRPEDCRRAAASRFGAARMVASYMSVYRRLAAGESLPLMRGRGAAT